MTGKDFENWQTEGTAVFLKNQLVLSPDSSNLKGVAYTTHETTTDALKGWIAQIDIDIGTNKHAELGSGGLAVYFLRNFEPHSTNGLYGYTNKFDGAAVVISTLIKNRV